MPSSFTNYCILKSPYGLTGSQCTNWSNQMTTDTIENSINPLHYINGMIGEPYYF
ncbi:hypothetical protein KBB05_00005 [Patescibacteria group bacterium]|nr:hypothetical protein [Patescibacteria group bacterium]